MAFWVFDRAAIAPDVIPSKYKELMAVASLLPRSALIALSFTRKPRAKPKQPNKKSQRSFLIASAPRAGGAITHGTHALRERL